MRSIAVPRHALAGQALLFGLWLGITAVGLALHPDASGHGTHTQLGLPPCPSSLFWDRPCPGCGLTTSIVALLHGRIADAFAAHAFGPLVYLGLTVVAWIAISRFFRGERFDTSGRGWTIGLTAFTVGFIAYGALRMALVDHYRSSQESRIYDAQEAVQRP